MKSYTVMPGTTGLDRWMDTRVVVVLMLQLTIYDSISSVTGFGVEENGLFRLMMFGVLGLATLFHIGASLAIQRGARFYFGGWPVFVMWAYFAASTAWSKTPDATLRKSVVVGFLILSCGVCLEATTRDWRKDVFSKLFALPMALLVAMSLFLTVAARSRSFTDIGWRGVASHKNLAGEMMIFIILILIYGVCHDKLRRPMRFALILLSGGLLLLAQSTTSLLGLVLAIGVTEAVTVRSTLRRMRTWQGPIFAAVLLVVAVLFFSFEMELLPSVGTIYSKILSGLGKSETFTGRTGIWDYVIKESHHHNVWLGGGYGGFWGGRHSLSGYVIIGDNLNPTQAHNGYLDVYNDLGYLGLMLLAFMVIVSLYRSARLCLLGHTEAKMHMSLALMAIFVNLGESAFFRNSHFMNIVFIASVVRSGSILWRVKLDAERAKAADSLAACRPATKLIEGMTS